MYWNVPGWIITVLTVLININMRCIEIKITNQELFWFLRLTLTWDVLKCYNRDCKLRSNRRLTLTWDVLKYSKNKIYIWTYCRLTLTWDVLKYFYSVIIWRIKQININMRCIEMNEVLHYTTDSDRININMRCIEMVASC